MHNCTEQKSILNGLRNNHREMWLTVFNAALYDPNSTWYGLFDGKLNDSWPCKLCAKEWVDENR